MVDRHIARISFMYALGREANLQIRKNALKNVLETISNTWTGLRFML